MKISCEIIKDLLPLYHDGVCSNESKDMVEEHLSSCEDCRAELQAMDNALTITSKEQNLFEADAVKKLSKRWKKEMAESVLKGALYTLATVIVVFVILYLFIGIRIS